MELPAYMHNHTACMRAKHGCKTMKSPHTLDKVAQLARFPGMRDADLIEAWVCHV